MEKKNFQDTCIYLALTSKSKESLDGTEVWQKFCRVNQSVNTRVKFQNGTIKQHIYTQAYFYHPSPFGPIIPLEVITLATLLTCFFAHTESYHFSELLNGNIAQCCSTMTRLTEWIRYHWAEQFQFTCEIVH